MTKATKKAKKPVSSAPRSAQNGPKAQAQAQTLAEGRVMAQAMTPTPRSQIPPLQLLQAAVQARNEELAELRKAVNRAMAQEAAGLPVEPIPIREDVYAPAPPASRSPPSQAAAPRAPRRPRMINNRFVWTN